MPSEKPYNNDFLSLLSKQREILKRLKREKRVATKDHVLVSAPQIEQPGATLTVNSTKHLLFANDSDPFSLMNEPIMEEHHPGCDEPLHMLPTFRRGAFTAFKTGSGQKTTEDIAPMNPFQTDDIASGRTGSRRHSLSGAIVSALGAFDADSATAEIPTRNIDIYNGKATDNTSFLSKEKSKRKNMLDPNKIDSESLRNEFVNFLVAMEKSMKSQQDIHDWDRKMGLKRSHSKTMRLSMRSRNSLRKVVSNV